MKKLLIGALVGGLLIFIWQTLSWTVLQLHQAGQEYSPKQDSILQFLNSQFDHTASYRMPNSPKGASNEEMQKQMEAAAGKPWVEIQYHQALNVNMTANIVRGLLVDIIMTGLLVWILLKMHGPGFGTTFISCLLVGLLVFLNSPYTVHIWYPKADIMAHLWDALISWGLCGLWLGWWLNRD